MVISNQYKEADLKKMKVKQLKALVYKAGIHGTMVAGARKEQLIAALVTGILPTHMEGPTHTESRHDAPDYGKAAKVFADIVDLIAESVHAKMERDRKSRPTPSSVHKR